MTHPVIDAWLHSFAASAQAHDLDRHMGHISEQVRVLGMPGFESLGYRDWYAQCEEEFGDGLVTEVQFHGLKIRAESEQQIMFCALEVLKTKSGDEHVSGVEMVLQKEDDANWRLRQERILNASEIRHHGLSRG